VLSVYKYVRTWLCTDALLTTAAPKNMSPEDGSLVHAAVLRCVGNIINDNDMAGRFLNDYKQILRNILAVSVSE
jgi:hypothetical protein